jgi:acyl-coenzyme A thioesterase 9
MISRAKDIRCVGSTLRRINGSQSLVPTLIHGRANALHTTASAQTDGVFQGLADKRMPTPWIEAFNRQKQGKPAHNSGDTPQERDQTPKTMSDSYHRVVLPLKKDPWLSDTYVNSSGHIR